MMRKLARFILIFALTGVAAAQAADLRFPQEKWDPMLIGLLKAGSTVLPSGLTVEAGPPPANDSQAVQEELDYLRGLKAQRTPELVEKIIYENGNPNIVQLVTEEAGLNMKKYPATSSVLGLVLSEVTYFLLREKDRFQRPRPSQLADDLDLVIENPGHAAYPSGHAGQSWALALVLGKLDPKRAEKYKSVARDIAWRRELAGVHYPSDSAAGRQVAEQVVAALEKNETFKAMFGEAVKEF